MVAHSSSYLPVMETDVLSRGLQKSAGKIFRHEDL